MWKTVYLGFNPASNFLFPDLLFKDGGAGLMCAHYDALVKVRRQSVGVVSLLLLSVPGIELRLGHKGLYTRNHPVHSGTNNPNCGKLRSMK